MNASDGNLPDNLEQLKAAIQLAADDEVFFIHRTPAGNIFPCLLLNDAFFYAAADGEDVAWDQVIRLRDMIRAGGWPEGVRWAQEEGREHANLHPIPPVQHSMNEMDRLRARIALLEKMLQNMLYIETYPKAVTEDYRKKLIEEARKTI